MDTITFTCADLSAHEPRTISVQGFLHGCREIGHCSLKQWLRMSMIPELKAIHFEPVYPGHGQLDPRYTKHPAIKNFLNNTSLIPSVEGKLLRFDFYGSSAETERPHLEESATWFLRARFSFTNGRNFSHVLAARKIRQETSLNAAGLIAYACSHVLETGMTEVEILVHGKSKRNIMRGTLQGWLPIDEIDEMKSVEIEAIHPGKGKPFMSDPIVQQFYATTALQGDPAAAGADKRLRVIHHGTEEAGLSRRWIGRIIGKAAVSRGCGPMALLPEELV